MAFGDVPAADFRVQALRCVDKLDDPDGCFQLHDVGEPLSLVRAPQPRQQHAVSELDKVKEKNQKKATPACPKARVRRVAPVPEHRAAPPVAAELLIDYHSDEDGAQSDESGRWGRCDDEPPGRDPRDCADAPPSVLAALFGKGPSGSSGARVVDPRLGDLSDAPPSVLAALLGKGPSGSSEAGAVDPRLGDLSAAPPSVLSALFGEGPSVPSGSSGDGAGGARGSGEAAPGAVPVEFPPEPPPPPPLAVPPPAEAVAPLAAPLARGRNEVRYELGANVPANGYIVKNNAAQSLDAHCHSCGCAVNRRFKPFPNAKSGKTKAQGRPMGLLIAWLEGECPLDSAAHRGMLGALTHAVRLRHRREAEAAGAYSGLFSCEREINDGDVGGEPLELP